MALIKTPQILGYPGAIKGRIEGSPEGTEMYDHIIRTMNLAYLIPMEISITGGTELWKAKTGWDEYKKYMKKGAGVDVTDTWEKNEAGLSVMFQHMSPMSESYSNTFSQNSLLAGIANGGNQNMQDMGMMIGLDGMTAEGRKKIAAMEGGMGEMMQGAVKNLDAGRAKIQSFADSMGSGAGDLAEGIMNAVEKFDHKIDFPMMWRGSNFSTSYSLMIRLYNPMPASDELYQQLIVAPTLALLGFVCPRSSDGQTWTYPFIMKFVIPGRADLKSCFCSNMTVVKGGDVNDVSWSSRPNIVDINMTIQPVHSVKLLSKVDLEGKSDAPTLNYDAQLGMMGQIKKNLKIKPGEPIRGNISGGDEAFVQVAQVAAGAGGLVVEGRQPGFATSQAATAFAGFAAAQAAGTTLA